jgi:predicted Zn-dependent protease
LLNVNSDVVRQLMEVGYLAAGRNLAPFAERIFAAIEAVRPDSDAPAVGRAMALLNAGEPAEAVATLRAAAAKFPQSETVKSFLGLALQMAGMNQESTTVLRDVLDKGSDPKAKAMAEAVLYPADE